MFWICSYVIKRDFTRCYLISCAIPISLNTFVCVIAIPIYFSSKQKSHHTFEGVPSIFSHVIRLLDEVTSQTFAVASCIFVFLAIRTASKREALDEHTAFNIFLPVPIGMFLLCLVSRLSQVTCLGKIAYWIAMALVYSCEIALAGLFVLVLLSLCFCSSPAPFMDQSDPTVANARHRLSWLIPYTFIAPFVSGLYIISYGRRYALYIDVQPMCILFAAFFFLPPYRTALFTCCKRPRAVSASRPEPIHTPPCRDNRPSATAAFHSNAPVVSLLPPIFAFPSPKPQTHSIYPNLHPPAVTPLNSFHPAAPPPVYRASVPASSSGPIYSVTSASPSYLLVTAPAPLQFHTGYVPSPRGNISHYQHL
ncbi:hypothetical protein WR25_12110 [Diploscapter pachys]|uniref:Uncharacterized protein n=1 Tax=Diploscapter pachys TaxID=2018661 RepID=A0A2A2JHC2_9BILA|nr:hypothetical protein WR25_12110 [Diploscapter pachys]